MSQSSRSCDVQPIARRLRSLVNLEETASTGRTLNLITAWRRHGDTEAYQTRPFFESRLLNKSIIVKHRLRPEEHDAFPGERLLATKIILPFSVTDMRAGARSFFVGQDGYGACLTEVAPMSGSVGMRDERLLKALDELPSLDPFLVRERLRGDGLEPARCYFDLSEADAARMVTFVRGEVEPLIGMSFDRLNQDLSAKIAKLADKILENATDDALDPLRRSLGMAPDDFEEGIFCWKGFIYYKWTLADLAPLARPAALQIATVKPAGPATSEERRFILSARARLAHAINDAFEGVASTLRIYEDAYASLTQEGRPQAFREFLLAAPAYFQTLGNRIGAVQDIVSFWRFRFPPSLKMNISAPDLAHLLADFEACFGARTTRGPDPFGSVSLDDETLEGRFSAEA